MYPCDNTQVFEYYRNIDQNTIYLFNQNTTLNQYLEF